ncbi:MAG: cob(I)yrinic acid a,c-diamide adenosyltransferase [Phycisphaeraceae bacterium]|nr:cob(I)yrinic acid a,c-diamide adenosyltransferase [Phycisphaeraceae bacterium]
MKLYTRTGDDGTTGLFGGARVSKDHIRVEAYGTVDELSAAIGLAAAACAGGPAILARIHGMLAQIQAYCFEIGADLATPSGSRHESKIARTDHAHIREIEGWIDEIDAGNAPMSHFVLPGGSEPAARLHLARTVCRRAERMMVTLAKNEDVTDAAIIYVNRLSDLLFAMARRVNRELGVADVPWIPRAPGT